MSNTPAKEQLVVIVNDPSGDGKEEAPGFIVYGLAAPGSITRTLPPGIGEVANNFRLYGEHWEVVRWDFPMWQWPLGDDWDQTLSTLLGSMITAGAKVAWIGSETMTYADPPWLFDPEYMTGGVPAWRTADGRQGGVLDPDRPLVPATIDELVMLRKYAAGLADTT